MVKPKGKTSADPLAAKPTESTSGNRENTAGHIPSRPSQPEEDPPCARLLQALRAAVLLVLMEIVWAFNAAFVFLILPLIVKTRKHGGLPLNPFIFCVTHVGELDPYFVLRVSRHYRTKALFERDGPEPIARFLLKAMWRFRVSQRPDLKPILNKQTIEEVVTYLKGGGILMVFPEGYRHWEKKLYPGVAIIARRANVPVVPVGIENGDVFRKELLGTPVRAMMRALLDYRRGGYVKVHFAKPIYPDPNCEEREDVNRLMRTIEARFREFYKQFYDTAGPVWKEESPAL
jgi:1-acyl-sn-glycerol-3-phosphate acyltransferase